MDRIIASFYFGGTRLDWYTVNQEHRLKRRVNGETSWGGAFKDETSARLAFAQQIAQFVTHLDAS